jgi:glycosyltransferase involved in cell wall biosynthesis
MERAVPVADISVVILCYRAGRGAEAFVRRVISALNQETENWEAVLVGNYLKGVPDETPQVVRALAAEDPRIKAVTLEKEGMMGWDARSGLGRATGWTIALIDGDGQMPAEDLVRVYRTLAAGGLDMVKTYRKRRDDGFLRWANSVIYNAVFRFLFPGFKVRDVNSKPKILAREFYEKLDLRSDDWFLDAEIIIQARRLGCRLAEVPTVFLQSRTRPSFIRVKHLIEFLGNLSAARVREFRR